jgi:TonB family protein
MIRAPLADVRIQYLVGTCGVCFQVDTDTAARLRASGASAAVLSLLQKIAPKKAPVIEEFSASARSITEGATVELTWRVMDAGHVELQPGIGSVSAEGSQKVAPEVTTVYKLIAVGVGGERTSEVTVEVEKLPVIAKFEVSPTSILEGEEAALSWQVENAALAEINGGIGQVSNTGSRKVKPQTSTAYFLTVRSQDVERKGIAFVQVRGPALHGKSDIPFVRVPGGEFLMGSSDGRPDEKPVHRVRITKAFEMGKYEVTQAQWGSVMGNDPSSFRGPDRPVESVSWDDIQEFLQKLNAMKDGYRYRLPTEAEWEYAARAGSSENRPEDLDAVAWHSANAGNRATEPVGEKQPNAWGLYDTLGNVWEWCQDWYDGRYYSDSPVADPPGPASGLARVVRGGSIIDGSEVLRLAFRNRVDSSGFRSNGLGFRLVREAGPAAGVPRPPVTVGFKASPALGGTSGPVAGVFRVGGGVSAPIPIYKIEAQYSEEARKAKFQGTLVLSIVVDEQGRPRDLKVVKPLGLGLDEKAIEAVRKWRFSPGKLKGKPVAVQASVQVTFRLLDPAASAKEGRPH